MQKRRTYRNRVHPTRIPFATRWLAGHFWIICWSFSSWWWVWACRFCRAESCSLRSGCYRRIRRGIAISKDLLVLSARSRFSNATAGPKDFAIRLIWLAGRLRGNNVRLAAPGSKNGTLRVFDTRWCSCNRSRDILATFVAKELAIRSLTAFFILSSFDEAAIGLTSKFIEIFLFILSGAEKIKLIYASKSTCTHLPVDCNEQFLIRYEIVMLRF